MIWKPKAKGNFYERASSSFWSETLNIKVRRTPASGAYYDMPADLMVMEDSVLKDFVIDVKSEQGLIAKKGITYYNKNREDSQGKPSFLEIYINHLKDSPLILISRKDLAKLLLEIDGYRKEKK